MSSSLWIPIPLQKFPAVAVVLVVLSLSRFPKSSRRGMGGHGRWVGVGRVCCRCGPHRVCGREQECDGGGKTNFVCVCLPERARPIVPASGRFVLKTPPSTLAGSVCKSLCRSICFRSCSSPNLSCVLMTFFSLLLWSRNALGVAIETIESQRCSSTWDNLPSDRRKGNRGDKKLI